MGLIMQWSFGSGNLVFPLVIVLLCMRFAVALILNLLNAGSVKSALNEENEKAVSYTLANGGFGRWHSAYSIVILGIFLFSGLLPWLQTWFYAVLSNYPVFADSLYIFVSMLILSITDVPFNLYSQFVIEEAFGFNQMTFKLWLIDGIKMFFLSALLGIPLLYGILYFVKVQPDFWWIYAWALIVVFQLVSMFLFPRFLLPMFNKLSPLEDEALLDRIQSLIRKTGFPGNDVFVMDGSRRSGHSNAFFTGFGKSRTIVLYDTLCEQLGHGPLCAVLAHEMGHWKKGHVGKMIVLQVLITGGFLYLVEVLSQWQGFYQGFGFTLESGIAPVFLIGGLLSDLVTFYLIPVFNRISRKHEYEADSYACEVHGNSEDLVTALETLHKENLSNPAPHPWYSGFYYSHPTIHERRNEMQRFFPSQTIDS
jgi:STE24 endopeptidase